jgi:hypothetical protein
MNDHTRETARTKTRIARVDITDDTMTGRGGLALFVRYTRNLGIDRHLRRLFGSLRRSRKGLPVVEIFMQFFCYFIDGTSRHLVHFDRVSRAEGYAAAIETEPRRMLSSHAAKRFLRAFSWKRVYGFRRLLQTLFIWRLKIERPAVIILGLDSMVMDNNEARVRHGVQPTYKKVKGFHPLHLSWGPFIIDSVFRGGSKHSNHGDTAAWMVTHIVGKIRKEYRADVPIIVRCDTGFFDQELFHVFEFLKIGYICGGKLYADLVGYVSEVDLEAWQRYENARQGWDYVELGDRRKNWSRFRRSFYLRPRYEDGQYLMPFARPDTVIYTNLGMGQKIDTALMEAERTDLMHPIGIIKTYHQRGADELVFRALKDFAAEQLPCKRFNQNAAYYSILLVAFFLYEAFKADAGSLVVPVTAYPTTVRRVLIDFAAKIVRHSGEVILKVTRDTYEQLRLGELWKLCGSPPPIT